MQLLSMINPLLQLWRIRQKLPEIEPSTTENLFGLNIELECFTFCVRTHHNVVNVS